MTNTFLEIQNFLLDFKHLGYRETTYAKLYSKAYHIAPQAWLHALFKPLTEDEVKMIVNKLSVPNFYKEFLMLSNGLSLFGTTLSLFGLRRNFKRDIDSVWQPFDLFDLNSSDKPFDSNEDHFFFASYDWDGSYVYYDYSDLKIKRCSCDSIKPLNIWNSFEDYIDNEIIRLRELFDNKGLHIDENFETPPPAPQSINN